MGDVPVLEESRLEDLNTHTLQKVYFDAERVLKPCIVFSPCCTILMFSLDFLSLKGEKPESKVVTRGGLSSWLKVAVPLSPCCVSWGLPSVPPHSVYPCHSVLEEHQMDGARAHLNTDSVSMWAALHKILSPGTATFEGIGGKGLQRPVLEGEQLSPQQVMPHGEACVSGYLQ